MRESHANMSKLYVKQKYSCLSTGVLHKAANASRHEGEAGGSPLIGSSSTAKHAPTTLARISSDLKNGHQQYSFASQPAMLDAATHTAASLAVRRSGHTGSVQI